MKIIKGKYNNVYVFIIHILNVHMSMYNKAMHTCPFTVTPSGHCMSARGMHLHCTII